jgi:hypothetical protein
MKVGIHSVKRQLDYAWLIKKRSPWQRLHLSVERPQALKPDDLVRVDVIHLTAKKPGASMFNFNLCLLPPDLCRR